MKHESSVVSDCKLPPNTWYNILNLLKYTVSDHLCFDFFPHFNIFILMAKRIFNFMSMTVQAWKQKGRGVELNYEGSTICQFGWKWEWMRAHES